MSLKILRLATHWDASDAFTVLAFIDELRDQILENHGDEIADMLRESIIRRDEQQLELPFDDAPPF